MWHSVVCHMLKVMNGAIICHQLEGKQTDVFWQMAFVIVFACLTLLVRPLYATEIMEDYCVDKPFSASCNNQQVLIINSARFGRMDFSVCVTLDFGFLGCQTDVLPQLDRLCSGKQYCEFPITTTLNVPNPCLLDLKRYLQVAHTCVPVVSLDKAQCEGNIDFFLRTESGYLSSLVAMDTGCGTASRPWVIEGKPFQSINFTLLDFSSRNFSANGAPAPCQTYATIEEFVSGEVHVICGGSKRKRHVYLSQGNRVRVILNVAPGDTFGQFLIKYEVVGCEVPTYPAHLWARRSGLHMTVGCVTSQRQWRLECTHGAWAGRVENCSNEGGIYPDTDGEGPDVPAEDDAILAVIVSIAIIACIGIIASGILYLRRRNQQTNHRNGPGNFEEEEDHELTHRVVPSMCKARSPPYSPARSPHSSILTYQYE